VDLRHPPHSTADRVPLDRDADGRTRRRDAEYSAHYARAAWEAALDFALRTT
jgi:hypothetical protein